MISSFETSALFEFLLEIFCNKVSEVYTISCNVAIAFYNMHEFDLKLACQQEMRK